MNKKGVALAKRAKKKEEDVEAYRHETETRKNVVPVGLASYDTLIPKPKKYEDDPHLEKMKALIPVEMIEKKILLIRGEKVMLDADLAELYQVETFNLNKAVKRNIDRFPQDFMFQLTKQEADSLRFQIGISKNDIGEGLM